MSAQERPDRLLLLDFPSIKNYVFGTDAAKEIRGASALLDHLNRVQLPRLLEQRFSETQFDVISAGGGKALVAFEGVPEKEVDAFLTAYLRAVADESQGGLSVEAVHLPLTGSFQATVFALHAKEALHRFSPQTSYPRQTSGLLRMCDSCTLRPAIASVKDGKDKEPIRICAVCQAKRTQKAQAIWKGFVKGYNADLGDDDDPLRPWDIRPEGFDAIAEAPQPRPGYYAVLYGDGDAMGKLIKGIQTPGDYKLFSETIDGSLREATYEVLQEVFPLVWGKDENNEPVGRSGSSRKPEPLPVDILLLGGDDLVLVVPASKALLCATKIASAFQKKTKEKFSASESFKEKTSEQGMTVSFGVALGKAKQPFFQILEQAEALLKSAKKMRTEAAPSAQGSEPNQGQAPNQGQGSEPSQDRGQGRATKGSPKEKTSVLIEPWIDFADVSQTRFLEIKDIRKEEYGVGGLYTLTMWPRSLSQTQALLKQAEAFQQQGFKPSRLYAWVRLLRKGGKRLTFEFYRQMTRLKDAELQLLLDTFEEADVKAPPWRISAVRGKENFSTPLLDLLTLLRYHAPRESHAAGESRPAGEGRREERKTKGDR